MSQLSDEAVELIANGLHPASLYDDCASLAYEVIRARKVAKKLHAELEMIEIVTTEHNRPYVWAAQRTLKELDP